MTHRPVTLRLLCTTASPFSAKVRMAAASAGIPLELVHTDTGQLPADLVQANPLGKIPVLLTGDVGPVSDSRVITQYLDHASGGRLFPSEFGARMQAMRLESICDGLCDALQAHVYERRFRPENMVSQAWLERQWGKAARTLEVLEAAPPPLGRTLHVGQIALRTSLGYLRMRFEKDFSAAALPRLVAWATQFDAGFPQLTDCVPRPA